MRPQRSTANAIAALSVSSSVTSASKAIHSPPSARTMAAVSSADAQIAVDREQLRAFAREAQRSRAAVAHPLSRRLAGADDDGDFSW